MHSGLNKNTVIQHLNSFLNEGALVQTSADEFKLFIGPFQTTNRQNHQQILLYKPEFWDFLAPSSDKSSFLAAEHVFDLDRTDLIELFDAIPMDAKEPFIKWEQANKSAFVDQFGWLANNFKANLLKKGLPITQQIGCDFNSASKVQIMKQILQKTSEQYLYGFWSKDFGFIGFTPEILISAQEKKISTMALAGTWSKQSVGPLDFNDPKIQEEHQIVVQDILTQLSDQEFIRQEPTKLLDLEYLVHLKTEFEFYSESVEPFIQKLHPTAALGLFPRSEKLFNELSKLELQKNRKNFGAPFGFVSSDFSFLVVAIRNIYWEQSEISIFSGCGVTAESDLETEWAELDAKRNSVKKTFGLNL